MRRTLLIIGSVAILVCVGAWLSTKIEFDSEPEELPAVPAATRSAPKTETTSGEGFSLTITDLPAGWEKHVPSREEVERRRLKWIVEGMANVTGPEDPDFPFLRRQGAKANAALLEKIKGDWWNNRDAWTTLLALGDSVARARFFEELRTGNAANQRALNFIDLGKVIPRTPEEENVVREVIRQGKIFDSGFLFRLREVSGVPALLIDALERSPGQPNWSVAEAAAEGMLTAEDAVRLLKWARAQASTISVADAPKVCALVARLAFRKNITKEAEALFGELHARFPTLVFTDPEVATPFCQFASADSRPMFEALLKKSADPTIRGRALKALARVGGLEMLPIIEPFLSNPETQDLAWRALEHLAEVGGQNQVDAFVDRVKPPITDGAVGYAMRHGSPTLVRRALELKDLWLYQRYILHWRANNLTAETFFQDLRARGLIAEIPSAAELARNRTPGHLTKSPENDAGAAHDHIESLGKILKIFVMIYDPAPDYESLFYGFSDLTQGAFLPRNFRHTEIPMEADRVNCLVEFDAGGKHCALRVQGGEYLDAAAVQATVNRVLELTGHRERVLTSDGYGPFAEFVYGLPETWEEIARKYRFPLTPGLSKAVQNAKDLDRAIEEGRPF